MCSIIIYMYNRVSVWYKFHLLVNQVPVGKEITIKDTNKILN